MNHAPVLILFIGMWEQLMWALQLTRRCAFGCWLAKGSRETENWEPFHLLGQFRTDEQNYLVFGRKTLLNIILAYLNMAFPIPKKPRLTLPADSGGSFLDDIFGDTTEIQRPVLRSGVSEIVETIETNEA